MSLASAAEIDTESASLAPAAESGPGQDPIEPNEQPVTTGALAAFASRPFAWFWPSLVTSLTGVWVRITAQGYLVYDLTDNELLLGLVSFANAAPVLIASPIAGAILDRVDRRRVLQAVQTTQGLSILALAILVATDRIAVWHVLVVAAIIGFASGFDWPARLATIPLLVEKHQLKSAVALTAAAFNGSRIVGPAIGGLLAGSIGIAACFFLNAALYLPLVLVLAFLPIRAQPARAATTGSKPLSLRSNATGEISEGYRYIWRTPTIRGLLSVDIVPLAFGISYFTLAPAVAKDVLGLGETGLGILLACNGVGSLAGTLLVALMTGVRRRGLLIVAGVGLFGLTIVFYALSANVILSCLLIGLLGLIASTYATLNDTLVQTLVDDAYRGRVLSVYSMLWGLTPIGGLIGGAMANVVGVQAALVINGFLVLLYVPVLYRFTPVPRID
jgi:MFS family permease